MGLVYQKEVVYIDLYMPDTTQGAGEQDNSLAGELFASVDRIGLLETKIRGYCALRTTPPEPEIADPDDEFYLPPDPVADSAVLPVEVIEPPVGPDGVIRLPDLEEMKSDFTTLAELVREKQKMGALPTQLWLPVIQLVEKFVASNVAPKDTEERWSVIEPVFSAVKENEGYLMSPEVSLLGGSAEKWISGVDVMIGKRFSQVQE